MVALTEWGSSPFQQKIIKLLSFFISTLIYNYSHLNQANLRKLAAFCFSPTLLLDHVTHYGSSG